MYYLEIFYFLKYSFPILAIFDIVSIGLELRAKNSINYTSVFGLCVSVIETLYLWR